MEDYPHFYLGCAFGLTSATSSGFAYLFMRRLGTHVDPSVNLLYFAVLCTCGTYFVMVGIDDRHVIEYDCFSLVMLALVGILGFTAQLGVNTALSLSNAGPMAALNYIQVVMAWTFDVTCFGATV